jgi:adenylosuccinate lyase
MIDLTELHAISPLDGRYWNRVGVLSPYVSETALIRARIEIEAKYLLALSQVGLVRVLTSKEKTLLMRLGQNLTDAQVLQVKEIEETTRHDVKAMERAMRLFLSPTSLADMIEMIHFGLTSEDINNLSYRLMLQRATAEVCLPMLTQVVDQFAVLAKRYRNLPMLARTHGQSAIPTTLGKELANFASRLHTQVVKLESIQLTGKLNGAVGNYSALVYTAPQIDWIAFSQQFVKSLGLEPNLMSAQINYSDDMIELFQAYERVNNVLVNINGDMWRYISDGWFVQEAKKGEVGSSTMPQKVNPIDFENSKGNAEIANGMFEGLSRQLAISWLQRDLSGSTAIRNIGVGLAHSLLAYQSILTGLSRVRADERMMHGALHKNWNILGEGVQTLLRKAGVADPYSLIAELTKGQEIDVKAWKKWVISLKQKPSVTKKLLALSPDSYIGNAALLVDLTIKKIKASR